MRRAPLKPNYIVALGEIGTETALEKGAMVGAVGANWRAEGRTARGRGYSGGRWGAAWGQSRRRLNGRGMLTQVGVGGGTCRRRRTWSTGSGCGCLGWCRSSRRRRMCSWATASRCVGKRHCVPGVRLHRHRAKEPHHRSGLHGSLDFADLNVETVVRIRTKLDGSGETRGRLPVRSNERHERR